VLLVAMGLAASSSPQSPASQQSPPQAVFRGGVDLVTIDVTVVDKDGRPVKGLTAEDFTVKLEGQVRPVRALDFLEFGSAHGSRTPTPRQTSNRSATSAGGGRVIVLVFDDLSYPAGRGKLQLAAAERMLSKFDADDLIGFSTTSGLGPAINPTTNRSVLVAALHDKRVIGRFDDGGSFFNITVNEAIEIDRGQPARTLQQVAARECPVLSLDPDVCSPMIEAHARSLVRQSIHRAALQLASFKHVIDAVRSAPSPRVLVAFSRGLAFGPDVDVASQLAPISQSAAESRVHFYVLTDAADDINMRAATAPSNLDSPVQFESLQTAIRDEGRFLISGIQTVASAAGGEAFVVVGTGDRFIERIERETSGFYRLGVEAPNLPTVARFASASVAVRQPGLTVHVNRKALVATASPEALPVEERLKTALAREGSAIGVPIALAVALRRDPASSDLQAAVNVQLPQSVPGPVVAMFGLVDTMGRVIQAGRKNVPIPAVAGPYQLAFPVPVSPGTYRLRFVVADAQGNVGSVEHRLNVSLLHLGSFSASDLLTTSTGADRQPRFLALDTLPDGATSLSASLELYPDDPARAPDVTVRLALLPSGKDTPIYEREITPQLSGATRIASGELPVASLSAGSYVIRATTLEGGVPTGTVTMPLRKTGAASEPVPVDTAATLKYFRHWLELAREHTPGQLDEAVREVRSYSLNRLEGLRGDLETLTTLLRNPYEGRMRRQKDYTDAEKQLFQELAFAELGTHTDNRLLRRIALLHTDAAVLPGAVAYVMDPWATASQGVTVSQDGVRIGLARLSPHLPIARAALASVFPSPADDEWVRAWYRATTAYLFHSAQIVALPDHLADRRKALPDDAGTTFAEACLYEVYASDQIQSAAQAERARGGKTNVPSQRDALLRARVLFGQVGADAPDYAEARVRLARTSLRLDDARAAAGEATGWLAGPTSTRDPGLRYYAYLVLGAARWALGDATAAAAAYEEALKLFPSAQSAIVALLVVKPVRSIENGSPLLAVLQAPATDRTDPWQLYSIGPGRHVDTLMPAVWKSPAIR